MPEPTPATLILPYQPVMLVPVSFPPLPPPEPPAPACVFAAAPATGTAPLTVGFRAAAVNLPAGTVVEFRWEFGDGSPAVTAGPEVSHEYAAAGSYTVSLTVSVDGQQRCGYSAAAAVVVS